jgi:predicted Zn finger-like uncharacterized protein
LERRDAMLLVCPSCATSYVIDSAALGSEGRTVRCARCKTTWFANMRPAPSELDVFVDEVIAEAQAESAGGAAESGEPARAAEPDFTAAETGEFDAAQKLPRVADWPEHPPAAGDDELAPETPPDLPAEDDPRPLAEAPPLVPPIDQAEFDQAAQPKPEAEDIETFAARRQRLQAKRKKAGGRSRWTAIVLVLFAVNVALVGARNEVVRYLPQTASLFAAIGLPVNLRGLAFEDVRITDETQDGKTILLIHGKIVSTAKRTVTVPRLRFSARNAAGQEIYSWTAKPERATLGPGESFGFQSRLAAPPAGANDVMVRFFTARDMAGEK